MKLSTLKKQAQKSSKARNHKMFWSKPYFNESGENCEGTCSKCNAWVQIHTKPQPNQINVGGNAVAVNCTK